MRMQKDHSVCFFSIFWGLHWRAEAVAQHSRRSHCIFVSVTILWGKGPYLILKGSPWRSPEIAFLRDRQGRASDSTRCNHWAERADRICRMLLAVIEAMVAAFGWHIHRKLLSRSFLAGIAICLSRYCRYCNLKD